MFVARNSRDPSSPELSPALHRFNCRYEIKLFSLEIKFFDVNIYIVAKNTPDHRTSRDEHNTCYCCYMAEILWTGLKPSNNGSIKSGISFLCSKVIITSLLHTFASSCLIGIDMIHIEKRQLPDTSLHY